MKPVTVLLLTMALAPVVVVSAQDQPGIEQIAAKWRCKFCPFDEQLGLHGEVEGGLGYVSDDSFKRGEYNGLHEEGVYLIGNADLSYLGEDAQYWDLIVEDLGLDSRYIYTETGEQGKYSLHLEYDEIPHFIYDTSETPFRGIGGNVLTLPPSWVPAPSTSGFTELANTLQPVDIKTQRKKLGVGGSMIAGKGWELTSSYTHERQDGLKTTGAAIGANFATSTATILPLPVDYTTHQLDVASQYSVADYQIKFGYYGSFFENSNRFLTWQNPFANPTDPVGSGSLSQPPDNQFHQLYFNGGYEISEQTRATAHVAIGRMLQDEDLLPYTVNPALQPPSLTGPLFPLPRDSADARIDTYTMDLGLLSNIDDKLRLSGKLRYQEQDNRTPREAYDYVIGDTAVVQSADAESNLPYGFKTNTVELAGTYRLAKRARLLAGIDYQTYARTFQEVEETDEHTLWSKITFRPGDTLDVTVKLTHSDRDGDAYQPVLQINPPQNLLLRKFNLADRQRNEVNVSASFGMGEMTSVGLSADYAEDDYSDSEIGLRESDDVAYILDLTLALTEDISAYGFYTREEMNSELAGASAFSPPDTATQSDWSESSRDEIDTIGVGFTWWNVIEGKLDIGGDYTYSSSTGSVDVDPGTAFPDVTARIATLELDIDYHVEEHTTTRLSVTYEEFDARDWSTDGVDVDTIPQVLSLGQSTPSYADYVVGLSVRHRF